MFGKLIWSMFHLCVGCSSLSLLATTCTGEGLGICLWSPRSRSWVRESHGLRVHEVNGAVLCFSVLRDCTSICGLMLIVSHEVWLFFSCRALFLLSKGMVSWNHSLLIKGTSHISCVVFTTMRFCQLHVHLWLCSCCWWSGSWARCTLCWRCVGPL